MTQWVSTLSWRLLTFTLIRRKLGKFLTKLGLLLFLSLVTSQAHIIIIIIILSPAHHPSHLQAKDIAYPLIFQICSFLASLRFLLVRQLLQLLSTLGPISNQECLPQILGMDHHQLLDTLRKVDSQLDTPHKVDPQVDILNKVEPQLDTPHKVYLLPGTLHKVHLVMLLHKELLATPHSKDTPSLLLVAILILTVILLSSVLVCTAEFIESFGVLF